MVVTDKVGAKWHAASNDPTPTPPSLDDWIPVLPFMDVWLDVETNEVHHVSKLLPSLDWTGGLLGVRLRYEPKDIVELYKNFVSSIGDVQKTKAAAQAAYEKRVKDQGQETKPDREDYRVGLWPNNMIEFLDASFERHFSIRAYPGVFDPKLKLSTRMRMSDSLNHGAAIQYEIADAEGGGR